MNNALLLAITIYCSLLSSSHVYSFSPSHHLQGGRLSTSSSSCRTIISSNNSQCRRTPTILFNDKQAEIAALEERLRQLKQEEESGGATTTELTTEEQRQQIMADAAATLTPDELAALDKINEESDDSIMFSEKWKEGDDAIMGTIKTAGLVIAGIVFLGLFSQIPVGESDLQKYQDVKGSSSRIDLGDLNPGVTVQR
eukprot:CAMPEP_0113430450 /NCGR_PEP_ID=MMETSP0013_2-20120614/33014_1 /TAXON_ID=2843 ORGANISM="Skeletonema costatum, Strain 1716" /NCGR_SAMPLE_ID=MMETSP0013_2 /ASSEMBLY_ACC=CAM_ASM_000158 /LENGTH=197 /DNA_ID=CAMNT_0000319289 /DNA_START=35 /DNA_END=628 /DNA_ORIENTATION=+ /assembly_acc=CAM_ASM_000158